MTMKKMTRKTFVKQALGFSTLLVFNPFDTEGNHIESDFYKRLVAANTKEVEKIIKNLSKDIEEVVRQLGYDYANLVSAYFEPTSKYYQNADLIPLMEKIMRFLIKEQKTDGTLTIGNFDSPPDTAFILEPICAATTILLKNTGRDIALQRLCALAKTFILKVGDALTEGGIHTPNHRWVISAALAQIHHLYPNKKYIKRIDEWFSENLYIDSEGHYLERSMIYSEVIDKALIIIARLLNRPKLLESVRKNLERVYYHIEPNGEMVTVDSRRQDQYRSWNALLYYVLYRYMAIVDKNSNYAAIANFIEKTDGFEEKVLSQSLFWFLETPLLQQDMPTPVPLNTDYEQFFKETNLVRFRKNDQTATIFGGTDKPLIIASGRSSNPNFFSFRKGEAILKHIRFSTDFFSTGYFRSNGIRKEGNKYILTQKIEVPYYQPLPDAKKRKDGDYKHSESIDHRFWNKMDFENRPVSNVQTLETTISIQEIKNGFDIDFQAVGTEGVDVTIELCFKEGGKLSDMKTFETQPSNNFLQNGMGIYTSGKDTITFGKGTYSHNRLRGIDGEVYSTHFGTLKTEGLNVYLTGKTPFRHTLFMG
jgi:hypothetical protein